MSRRCSNDGPTVLYRLFA